MSGGPAPIIIKRVVEEGGHGHHGGAWKVAYADFVTAMMAFFLLLWLLSSSSEEKLKGLAEYFSEASENTGPPGGVGGIMDGISISPNFPQIPSSPFNVQPTLPFREDIQDDVEVFEVNLAEGGETASLEQVEQLSDEAFEAEQARREQEAFEETRQTILDAIDDSEELAWFKENLAIDQTPEGLRIQIVDQEGRAMFPSGSAVMYPHLAELLRVVTAAIGDMPNKLSIRGHTDSTPFPLGIDYDNWRLSSDRADATRRAMLAKGLDPSRVAEVVGRASADPFVAEDPSDPRNRRISLVLLNSAGDGSRSGPGGEDEAGAASNDKVDAIGSEETRSQDTPPASTRPPGLRLQAPTLR